ncbi:MAG: pyrimidine-nucleoside phosphorylase [bacterium]|jgi:pyrimidine-nucleoside phosphorylase
MLFLPELIAKKRDGSKLTAKEIYYIINSYVSGEIPDYQIAALLMAIYFQGMDEEETTHFTLAMAQSGQTLDLSNVAGITVDKHSTGGIADTTTLVLLPLAAAAGVKVAKMSGRGLGHTGGTIDKLESIPGFRTDLTQTEFIAQVNRLGAAITGQSKELVPADKHLYALRDVTATVDSLPLIASSIMSKKIAGGAEKIVLDVKCGQGAFMKQYQEALKLAQLMVKIGHRAGRETIAYVTDMGQPLGLAIGNSLEVIEAIEALKGKSHPDLLNLCLRLGAEMMNLAGVETDFEKAQAHLLNQIKSGAALRKFREIIAAQGGVAAVIDNYALFPGAQYSAEFIAEADLYIKEIDVLQLAITALKLGAGRGRKEDVIDPAVGIVLGGKIGDQIMKGQPIATIYANDPAKLAWAYNQVKAAIRLTPQKVARRKLVYTKITAAGE